MLALFFTLKVKSNHPTAIFTLCTSWIYQELIIVQTWTITSHLRTLIYIKTFSQAVKYKNKSRGQSFDLGAWDRIWHIWDFAIPSRLALKVSDNLKMKCIDRVFQKETNLDTTITKISLQKLEIPY